VFSLRTRGSSLGNRMICACLGSAQSNTIGHMPQQRGFFKPARHGMNLGTQEILFRSLSVAIATIEKAHVFSAYAACDLNIAEQERSHDTELC